MATVLLTIGILGAAFLMLSLRILLVPGGTFRGTCATNNPMLDSDGPCVGCRRPTGEPCPRRRRYRLFGGPLAG